jgi:N,N'-diacetyllegionaminate synthase
MENTPVIIIAEAGVNHNGDINLAKQLIDIASDCGADYVKFQTFKTELLVDEAAPKAEYQIKNMAHDTDNNQFEMLKKLELSQDDHHLLKAYCVSKNIKFLSTAFDDESLNFLVQLGVDFIKIPSGELNNLLYLKRIAALKIPTILSTGMGDMQEIETALNILLSHGLQKKDITVLQCTTNYPAAFNEINLSVIKSIRDKFDIKVGYSDHTLGIEASVAAVAMGAKIIEKHFTISKEMLGPDHKASLEKAELKALIGAIRNIEQAIGNGIKAPSENEQKIKLAARKSAFAKIAIQKGEIIKEILEMINQPSSKNYLPGQKIER